MGKWKSLPPLISPRPYTPARNATVSRVWRGGAARRVGYGQRVYPSASSEVHTLYQ